MVWSDKADYAPGEHVTLTGAHWAPGETVHIRVNDGTGSSWDRDVDVTADEFGRIVYEFNLPDSFVAKYRVTATGSSGATAATTFTDGNLSLHLSTAEGVVEPNTADVSYRIYSNTTGCPDSATGTPGTTSIGPGGKVNVAVGKDDSVKLTGVTTTQAGRTFDRWTSGTNQADGGTEVSGNPTPCVAGSSGNAGDLWAHFKAASENTSLSASSATGTLRRHDDLSATLKKSDGTALSGKTVSFQLNGVSVGTATTTPSGIATKSGVSLVGINAGSHPDAVSASFDGDNGFKASSATGSLTVAPRAITVTADDKSKVYGSADPALTGHRPGRGAGVQRQPLRQPRPRGRQGRRQLRDHEGLADRWRQLRPHRQHRQADDHQEGGVGVRGGPVEGLRVG